MSSHFTISVASHRSYAPLVGGSAQFINHWRFPRLRRVSTISPSLPETKSLPATLCRPIWRLLILPQRVSGHWSSERGVSLSGQRYDRSCTHGTVYALYPKVVYCGRDIQHFQYSHCAVREEGSVSVCLTACTTTNRKGFQPQNPGAAFLLYFHALFCRFCL